MMIFVVIVTILSYGSFIIVDNTSHNSITAAAVAIDNPPVQMEEKTINITKQENG